MTYNKMVRLLHSEPFEGQTDFSNARRYIWLHGAVEATFIKDSTGTDDDLAGTGA